MPAVAVLVGTDPVECRRRNRVRDYGGGTRQDRCRGAPRRRACRFSWPAPDSRGGAPGRGPACPPRPSGHGGAGPPLSGPAKRRRRPTHPGRAHRCPPALAAGPRRPLHPGGNAPPPRPTSPIRTARPAPPAQDREAPQPPLGLPDPHLQLGRPSGGAERTLELCRVQPAGHGDRPLAAGASRRRVRSRARALPGTSPAGRPGLRVPVGLRRIRPELGHLGPAARRRPSSYRATR